MTKKKKYLYSVKNEERKIYGSHAKAISSFDVNHLTKNGIKKAIMLENMH